MPANNSTKKFRHKLALRTLHRYVGFFMIGLIIVYALSGTLLLLRNTSVLKKDIPIDTTIEPHLNKDQLIAKLRLNDKYHLRHFKIKQVDGNIITFKKGRYNSKGTYNASNGELKYTKKEYPKLIERMLDLHKNKISKPSSAINIAFVVSLLFFVFTSFFMYEPRSKIFKRGMGFMAAGIIFAILAVLFL